MPKPPINTKLAFIGAGQMAESLIGGLLESGAVAPTALWATDTSADRRGIVQDRFGIRVGHDNRQAASWADIALLAVKPQSLGAVLDDLAPALSGQLVISIAAGVPLKAIAERVPNTVRLIRVMPNAAALIREGMSAVSIGPGATEDDMHTARSLLEAVGRVVVVEERLMHAVTGLSGSGPAYAAVAIEALADGGVKMGLPRTVAELLAAQTMLGAAKMVLETGEHPARLKDRVASPGGTTIAGLHRLEGGGFRTAVIAAVEAATKKSEALGPSCW